MAYTSYRYMVYVYVTYEFLNVNKRGDDCEGLELCLEIIVAVQP
jgi:hypothetical protein